MDIKQLIASAVETVIKIAVVVFLVTFVYDAAIKAYDYGYRVFAEEPVSVGDGRTISISVEASDSVRDIGKNLEDKGLIRDANLFFVQELLSEYHGELKPGIYDLNTSMTTDEMMEIMSAEPKEEEEEAGASTDNVPIGEVEENEEGTEGENTAGDADGAEGAEGAGNDNG
ncbi:MAG: endolytic transglycosylase MltG [Bacillus sp. (in: Bacteria)]|nr:endolytic transglycosylase MltG [Bacillus sp. (in: firmicutes)]MCM1425075.1 endolytic transglycosylase MltG [Eubacterium sp.]